MFSESYTHSVDVINKSIRSIFIWLDHAFYGLLELVYQLFFNVASADIIKGPVIAKFYGRVQLILGVFMLFQLALIILKGIVNPESFTDKKSGAGNFVTRVVTALVLLTVLVPINVPKSADSMNEYEKQINNNGLLFGTLYSLQHRLLSNNTIGKLVLGTSDADTFDADDNEENLRNSAKSFTATIVKGFYRVNLIPYKDRMKHAEDGDDAEITSNRMCDDMGKTIDIYRDENSSAGDILDIANETCSQNKILDNLGDIGTDISVFAGKEMYMFTMMPLVSTAAAIIFIIIFISFTIDVAVRAIKLAVLRLIAPIPIISYMDPKGSKDSAFNSWVKSLTSTYLDLFVRLAIIYFVLFIIQDMVVNKISVAGAGALGFMSSIAVWIGLFVFAKQAPKFIRQVLGLKDDGEGKGIFSGLGEIGRAFGMGAAALGGVGVGIAAYRASRSAYDTNHPGEQNGFGVALNRGKSILSGIFGGAAGAATGIRASYNAKDHAMSAGFNAQQSLNARRLSRGADGYTFGGAAINALQKTFMGQDSYEKDQKVAAIAKAQEERGDDLFKYLEGKGKTDGGNWKVNTSFDVKDKAGNVVRTINLSGVSYSDFKTKIAEAKELRRKDPSITTFDIAGQTFSIEGPETDKALEELAYAAGTQWARGMGADDAGYTQKRDDYKAVGGTWTDTTTVSQLKKDVKKAGGAAKHAERSAEAMRHKAQHISGESKK